MFRNIIAEMINERGRTYLDQEKNLKKAKQQFLRAAAIAPKWGTPWYNLGLAAKWERSWQESLVWNNNAVERDPAIQTAWWNMGIAATALSNWSEARRAWTGFGIELPPGKGEIVMELGPTPIRLNPETSGEVVWCRRIDPARALIRNVPLPSSGYRYGDLLLHDGAPSGQRILHGTTLSVFDVIERLHTSNYLNFEVEVHHPNSDALLALFQCAADSDVGLEDWGTIRCLCSACSQATVPVNAEEDDAFVQSPASNGPVRLIAAAPDLQRLNGLLVAWTQYHNEARILRVEQISD